MLVKTSAQFLCFLAFSSRSAKAQKQSDVLSYVDQLIGTYNAGNVFAGASLPYGMAKAVADCNGENTAGFATDGSQITGFSAMHDSGTGGEPSMGNFPLFPQPFCPGDVLDNCNFAIEDRATHYLEKSVKASPGYFSIKLKNGVQTEATATSHAALYRMKFPSSSNDGSPISPLMLMDLTDLAQSRQNATVVVDPDTGRITGKGVFLPSFGSGYFQSYACMDFKGAKIRDTGIYVNSRAGTYPKTIFVERGIDLFYIQAGGFTRFHAPSNGMMYARVGVSLISVEQACANAENEISDWNFDKIRNSAADAWRDKLSTVSVRAGGASEDMLTIFWSGFYRTMLSPQNYTGENPLWTSNEPYFDSFYCLWDMFRTQQPWLTIVDAEAQSQMVRSLIDTWRHEGWLPDCRMSLDKGFTQGGSNADVVLADAYIKNQTGIDWNDAYAAVKTDAEKEPIDWSNEGRGGLVSWKRLNYIPYLDYDYLGFGTNSRSISRTLEYSYNDFCVATLAKALGLMDDYTKYLARSSSWMNLYKKDQTSFLNGSNTGFTGFFQPRFLNGTWGYQNPTECGPLDSFCSLTSNPRETFEDSIWEYQFFVPQDMSSLIDTFGGADAFVKRLRFLHTSGLHEISNEPSFLTVFQYHYAGRPGLSAKQAHTYIPSDFNTSTNGLPGNDDSGVGGAFLTFLMSGLFPNAGQDVYLITPPYFESVSFRSPVTGKKATIRNTNFDPTYKKIYIQSATLNGKPYTKNWIGHEFFLKGWTLELTLGRKESSWGQALKDLPPSSGVGSGAMNELAMFI